MVLFVCLPWNTFWYIIREKIAAILKIEEVPVQPAEKLTQQVNMSICIARQNRQLDYPLGSHQLNTMHIYDRQHLSTYTVLCQVDSPDNRMQQKRGGIHLGQLQRYVWSHGLVPFLFYLMTRVRGATSYWGLFEGGGQSLLCRASQENLKQWLPTKSANNDKMRGSIVWLKYENPGEDGFPPSLAEPLFHLNIDNTFH